MIDGILFWMAKPLAEFMMAMVLVGGIGVVMTLGAAARSLDAWIDKKRRNR